MVRIGEIQIITERFGYRVTELNDLLMSLARQHADERLEGIENSVWMALEKRARALSIVGLLTAALATAVVTTISFSDARTAARDTQLRKLLIHGGPDNISPALESAF